MLADALWKPGWTTLTANREITSGCETGQKKPALSGHNLSPLSGFPLLKKS